jgi:hypothetical protein
VHEATILGFYNEIVTVQNFADSKRHDLLRVVICFLFSPMANAEDGSIYIEQTEAAQKFGIPRCVCLNQLWYIEFGGVHNTGVLQMLNSHKAKNQSRNL